MIGNLFNAVSIAIMSGVMAIGGAKASLPMTSANVPEAIQTLGYYNDDVYVYPLQTQNNVASLMMGSSGYYTIDGAYHSMSDMPSTTYTSPYAFDDIRSYVVNKCDLDGHGFDDSNPCIFGYVCYAVQLTLGQNTAYYIRGHFFGNPYQAKIIYQFQGMSIENVVEFNALDFFFVADGIPNNSFCLFDSAQIDLNADFCLNGNDLLMSNGNYDTDDEFFFNRMFLHHTIQFNFGNPSSEQDAFDYAGEIVGYFKLLVSYDDNFANAFNQGYQSGYKNGYGDGINVSQTGVFNNLFNSIADTPLRFIYGLFNFDLFGISCLVIILSLVSAIIVFGIVKKFWK